MLQHCHKEASRELSERDVARGLPKSLSCGRWVTRNGASTFVVDPILSRLKHSGEEHGKLRAAKWEAFCAEPRDPAIELAKIGETPSPDETPRMHMAGLSPTIEAAIAAGIEAGLRAAGLNSGKTPAPHSSPASARPMTLRQRAKCMESEPATAETT